ncbi:MAG: CYTH domain-containing protein [Dysgonamonadaceae bacterium]|jgi:CYTH domain-containing protein|nr:CYTH domain-containing protein [Dysgonamonadaceae bacterium]
MNNIEIERKFSVIGEFFHLATKKISIRQGYLSSSPDKTVRIRVSDGKGFITIKGPSDINGFSRAEYEYVIPLKDAEEMLGLCSTVISKERYYVPHGRHEFQVDVFHGRNEGLVIAELELQSEDEPVERPDWLGEEVTGIKKYYNSWLASH